MSPATYLYCMNGIVKREVLRFLQQRTRLLSVLLRPLLWLVVFAAGVRSALGISIMEPYSTYITYQQYITPGLGGMIILFHCMQSSLSMVYDREMGSMKVLLMSPMPRPFLLFSKLVAGAILSTFQVLIFLFITRLVGVDIEFRGYIYAVPAIFLIAFFLSALGLMLANLITQLENFAGVMNFVIFPMFFLSSALYPLWKMQEASAVLFWICQFNPFTHCVELLRFSLYGQVNELAFSVVFISAMMTCAIALVTFRGRG